MSRTARTPQLAAPSSVPSSTDLGGETFGDFRILRCLGQGGMGQVYLAEQISLRRKVAIKMLRDDVAAKPTALERFQAESKTVAQLNHPNIVQVYMVGEHEGRHYMALEYVEGVSLRDYLDRKGALDVPLVLSLMRQVATALHRASEAGIIHRDLKPENILLNRKGEAKVADFGLSRCFTLEQPHDLTREGSAVGTPMYMSPEQVTGKPVDYRSDIYSFGVTCYYMLTGQPPFTASNAYELAFKHVREEPAPLEQVRPDVPAALGDVVRKMMAKKPTARYQSAQELLKDIARVREALSTPTTAVSTAGLGAETAPARIAPEQPPAPTERVRRVRKRPVRRRWLVAVSVLAVVTVVLGAAIGGGIALYRRFVRPPASSAQEKTAQEKNSKGDEPQQREDPQKKQEREEARKRQEREDALRKTVDQHLADSSPNPNGVEACMDLAVLYLEQEKVGEAEALFKRMAERRPPSAYHFVGRLGLAVIDALHDNTKASHAKLQELFDPKSRDNRVQILNDYLTKNAEFAKWVNEADSQNVRNGATESSLPHGLRRPPTGRPPFRRQ
jgi:serine/threonine-protein kinase